MIASESEPPIGQAGDRYNMRVKGEMGMRGCGAQVSSDSNSNVGVGCTLGIKSSKFSDPISTHVGGLASFGPDVGLGCSGPIIMWGWVFLDPIVNQRMVGRCI